MLGSASVHDAECVKQAAINEVFISVPSYLRLEASYWEHACHLFQHFPHLTDALFHLDVD